MSIHRDEHRITARPLAVAAASTPEPGLRSVIYSDGCEGMVFIQEGYSPDRPAPLAVLCHGAGSEARAGLCPLLSLADEAGLVLLAPDAHGSTWDLLVGDAGKDAEALDDLLAQTFAELAIDPDRVALGGFSDGASYALSVGLANGDLFTHLIAFSPGFAAPPARRGQPRVFMSHGRDDRVLSIDRCSRIVERELSENGFDLVYREFDDGHTVPPDAAREAAEWLVGRELTVPCMHESPGEPELAHPPA